MSMMLYFYAVLFIPRDVLDEILDLIESVSEGFLPTLIWMIWMDKSTGEIRLNKELNNQHGLSSRKNTT